MEIYRIIEREGNEFRISVKANDSMNKAWLKVLNEKYNFNKEFTTFEEAMSHETQCYLSNNEGFLVMEVIRNLEDNTYYIEYYFDDYEYIDAELSEEEIKDIDEFISKNM